MKFIFFFFLFVLYVNLIAQDTLQSKYGKSLPAHGTLRILIIYAEIDYDVNPSKDPQASFTYKTWKPDELPNWKVEMADPFSNMIDGKGSLTKFYNEASFGNCVVLGDYVPFVVTVKESETNSSNQTHVYNQKVLQKVCSEKEFISANGLLLNDFDLWTLTSFGKPKITPSTDNPSKIDHVMIIYRNIHSLPVDHGFTSQGSPSKMCGLDSDTYSTFSCPDHLPFNVPKHEYAHLLLGDNNFHPYGRTVGVQSYTMFQQLGWSLLSSASATLLTCNAWDRDRLEWKPKGKKFTISTLNETGNEISTDLDTDNPAHAGIYFIRDFITSGDAIRIKIPVAHQETKYPQWIWIENHQTIKRNNSKYDKFQYQDSECTDEATPGLYLYMQISKNEKEGISIYGGYNNYLKNLIANGNYDLIIEDQPQKNSCINDVLYHPYSKLNPNPFTGTHNQELTNYDKNKNGNIENGEDLVPAIEFKNGEYLKKLGYLGDADNAFSFQTKRKIGIGTNPSTAPVINPDYSVKRIGSPANRIILLNGISVEILEELPDGTIKVKVRFDDTDLTENVRWCADSIWLPEIKGSNGYSLNLQNNVQLHLDQGTTPTRFTKPVTFKGEKIFADQTIMECLPESSINMNEKAEILIDNGSTFILNDYSKLILGKRAKISVRNGSKLIIKEGGKIDLGKKSRIEIDKSSLIFFNEKSIIRKESGAKIKVKGKRMK